MKINPLYRAIAKDILIHRLIPIYMFLLRRLKNSIIWMPIALSGYAAYQFSPSLLTLVQLWMAFTSILLVKYIAALGFAKYVDYELNNESGFNI